MDKNSVSYIREKDLATLSSRGQLVIPKSFRKNLNLQTGDYIGLVRIDDFIVLKKVDFDDQKVEKTAKKAQKNKDFTFEELLYPAKK
jgi:AbrB family looped-hinge helix DNA binding protein